jgi:hypothetical protein
MSGKDRLAEMVREHETRQELKRQHPEGLPRHKKKRKGADLAKGEYDDSTPAGRDE